MRNSRFLSIMIAIAVLAIALAGSLSTAIAQDKPAGEKTAVAIFAGGCFWCMEGPFDALPGVISTTSGYTGGTVANPTYHQVSSGATGHAEAVKVVYDPAKVTYDKLLNVFWHNVDPFAKDRQFCDSGSQYRSAIFFMDEAQHAAAISSLKAVQARFPNQRVRTEVVQAGAFYPAEDYHQDFYIKNPTKYKFYRWNCGRDQRLKEIWGNDAGHGS